MNNEISTHLQISLESMMRSIGDRNSVDELISQGRKWDAFRTLYKNLMPEIMGRKGDHYGIDPYYIDWVKHFTPIEFDAWQTIRLLGLPLYPQFPVCNVFVDFGDPVKKIAFECDGKDFHDKDKDFARDSILFDAGWVVFRATGSECHKADIDISRMSEDLHNGYISDGDFDDQVKDWAMNTSDGLIHAIGHKYYGKKLHKVDSGILNKSLLNHSAFFYRAN